MKTERALTQDRDKAIAEIIKSFTGGIEALHAAGVKLCQCLEEDPLFMDYFHKSHPEFSWELLAMLERIGRGELHPKLLLDGSPGGKRAALLPYSTQVKLLDKGVEVARKRGKEIDIEVKPLAALTFAESQIVFEASHVLSADEQVKRLEQRSIRTRPARAAYEIGDDGVVVPYRFLTWAQILELAKRVPKKLAA